MRAAIVVLLLLTLGCEEADRTGPSELVAAEDLAVCGEAPGPRRYVGSIDELRALLVGRWMSCQGGYLELGPAAMAGLELLADGTYWVLVPTGGGGLERATGADASGTWDVLQTNETAFQLADGRWMGLFTWVEEEPRRVSWGQGFDDLRWFAADRDDRAADVAGYCAMAPGSAHPWNPDECAMLPVGRWAWCEAGPGPRPPMLPPDAAGMELTEDGRLHALRRTSLGTLVRGVGVLYEGDWYASPASIAETVSLCLGMPVGNNCYFATYTDAPRGMSVGDEFVRGRWVLLP